MSINFYRLIDKIDCYQFIERFFDIGFYRLNTSGNKIALTSKSKDFERCITTELPDSSH